MLVIITGASVGIGAALARQYHLGGHTVGLVARRETLLEELCAELGSRAAWRQADVTDEAQLSRAIHELEGELGPCDLLIANAGIALPNPATTWDSGVIAEVMRVNYEGVVHAVGAVLPGMLERGQGALAVISSLASYRGMPAHGAYSASKAAVSNLFESLRLELKPTGIGVTTIQPGFIDTAMTRDLPVPMPFLMAVDDAAKLIVRRLESRPSEINFPWQVALPLALAKRAPAWLWNLMGSPLRRSIAKSEGP